MKSKKTLYTFFYLYLFVFIVACNSQSDVNKYFPLQKGLSWEYKITTTYPEETNTSFITIKTLGKKKIDGKSYNIRRTSSGIDYYINADEKGIYREGLRTKVEVKPRKDNAIRYVLKYPLEIGSAWNEISGPIIFGRLFPYKEALGDEYKFPLNYQIVSTSEIIEVDAGRYENCIKVVGEGTFGIYTDAINGYVDIPILVEEWYAPNVGLVKLTREEIFEDTKPETKVSIFRGGKTVLELQSFQG